MEKSYIALNETFEPGVKYNFKKISFNEKIFKNLLNKEILDVSDKNMLVKCFVMEKLIDIKFPDADTRNVADYGTENVTYSPNIVLLHKFSEQLKEAVNGRVSVDEFIEHSEKYKKELQPWYRGDNFKTVQGTVSKMLLETYIHEKEKEVISEKMKI